MKFLLPIAALLYAVSPYDFFPDFFVGLGWIDDLIILGLVWWYLFVYRKKRPGLRGYSGRRQGDSRERGGERAFESQTTESRDPYTILGVDRNASSDEVKKAYRRLASKYHPDKVLHLGEEFRELAEKRFKEIQEAFRELTSK
jgi:hypothetical protein